MVDCREDEEMKNISANDDSDRKVGGKRQNISGVL